MKFSFRLICERRFVEVSGFSSVLPGPYVMLETGCKGISTTQTNMKALVIEGAWNELGSQVPKCSFNDPEVCRLLHPGLVTVTLLTKQGAMKLEEKLQRLDEGKLVSLGV